MTVKLLPEHHLEFLSLKGGCIGSSESKLVKMPHFWKSHALAHYILFTRSIQHSSIIANCRDTDKVNAILIFQLFMRYVIFKIINYSWILLSLRNI